MIAGMQSRRIALLLTVASLKYIPGQSVQRVRRDLNHAGASMARSRGEEFDQMDNMFVAEMEEFERLLQDMSMSGMVPPNPGFDISNCEEYENEWLQDLDDSCDEDPLTGNFDGCECTAAQALFDDGEIECAERGDGSPPACPEDCDVCEVCLVRDLGCDNIYTDEDFDIASCDTYDDLWLAELDESCVGDNPFDDFEGCVCASARRLFRLGEIECAVDVDPSPPACPLDCDICQLCLVEDLDCDNIYA